MKFPNEGKAYRVARNKLLNAEKALRAKGEAVAALRRKLPAGGEVPQNYVFESEQGPVRLSQLFERGDTLLAYSFMYSAKMAQACPMCTSMLDGLNGNSPHVVRRVSLVVIAKSPIGRIREFAQQRGWSNLRLLSSAGNSYNRDYFGDGPEGNQMPMLNVFVRRAGKIKHFWGTELLYAKSAPGQHPRHVDSLWPLWSAFDLTPEGRGKDWYPKLEYRS